MFAWLTQWIFETLFVAGVITLLVIWFLPNLNFIKDYKNTAQIAAILALVVSAFFLGVGHEKESWKNKVAELQNKVAKLEVEASKVNVKIVEKIVYKDRIIDQGVQTITEYIDRYITKYDNTCIIPPDAIDVHNKAAGE